MDINCPYSENYPLYIETIKMNNTLSDIKQLTAITEAFKCGFLSVNTFKSELQKLCDVPFDAPEEWTLCSLGNTNSIGIKEPDDDRKE